MMTDQEIFDKVTTHLLKQNQASRHSSLDGRALSACMYRGPDGLKCAVGALIPDGVFDKYIADADSFLNSTAIDGLPDAILYESQIISTEMLVLERQRRMNILRVLQGVHDTWQPHEWREVLQKTAERFNLTFPSGV